MAARIDTMATVEVEVGGDIFIVRTVTARAKNSIQFLSIEAGKLLEGIEPKDATPEVMQQVLDLQFEILEAGLVDDPDTVDPAYWNELIDHVYRQNGLIEEDAKNSQSA